MTYNKSDSFELNLILDIYLYLSRSPFYLTIVLKQVEDIDMTTIILKNPWPCGEHNWVSQANHTLTKSIVKIQCQKDRHHPLRFYRRHPTVRLEVQWSTLTVIDVLKSFRTTLGISKTIPDTGAEVIVVKSENVLQSCRNMLGTFKNILQVF